MGVHIGMRDQREAVDLCVDIRVHSLLSTRPPLRFDTPDVGSAPPLGPSYAPLKDMPDNLMEEEYRSLCSAMAEHVDVFLCETMASIREAQIAAQAARACGRPVWVAFTLRDAPDPQPQLRSGESLHAATEAMLELGVEAILVNCCSAGAVTAAVRALHTQLAGRNIRIGGYANGFRQTTDEWLQGRGEMATNDPADFEPDAAGTAAILPHAYARHAQAWVGAGADIVGGCCGIGPAHMRVVCEKLKERADA